MPQMSFRCVLLALILLLGVSGNTLYLVGISYDTAGGNALHKIHPSFYLLLLAILHWLLFNAGGAYRLCYLAQIKSHLLLICSAALMLFYDAVLARPLSSAIVSYCSAAMILLLLKSLSFSQLYRVRQLVLVMLSVNALVGLYEFVSGGLIAPLVLVDLASGDVLDTSGWITVRSAGLLGHPIISTVISGFFLVSYVARRFFSAVDRAETFTALLLLLALPVFGGRWAILSAMLVIVIMLSIKAYQLLKLATIPRSSVVQLAVTLLMLPMLIYLAFLLGLLDPVLQRLDEDQGSAATRLVAIQLLFDTPLLNIILGDIDHSLAQRMLLYGTQYGIEIGWLALVLNYGLLLSGVLLYAIIYNVRALCVHVSPLILFPWLYAAIAWTSGTGIAGKTVMLSIVFILSIALFFVDDRRFRAVVFDKFPS